MWYFQLIVDDKWGDWRPHLCIILSNPTQKAELDKKSIITLGDTLGTLPTPCCYSYDQHALFWSHLSVAWIQVKNKGFLLFFFFSFLVIFKGWILKSLRHFSRGINARLSFWDCIVVSDFIFSFIFVLASRGLFFAAQFCYVVAQVPFGRYRKKSSKIVLLGASHRCCACVYLVHDSSFWSFCVTL